MKKDIILKIALTIAAVVFASMQIALALQVPNMGDYDNDSDYDFVMSQIVMQHNSTLFYEMDYNYSITPINATYGFFIELNTSNPYLDVFLVYANDTDKLLRYDNATSNFTDITALAGVGGGVNDSIGATTADFNEDNCSDLFAHNQLYMGYNNGSFRDVTNESNLAELPRLKAVVAWDFNEDNLTDILGLQENGTELVLMLNMGDNNDDNISEFWDASVLSELTDLTKSDLGEIIANSAAVGWIFNHPFGSSNATHTVTGIYIPRNGTDILLDTYLSSAFSPYSFAGIPEFRWLNVSAIFNGSTSSILGNSSDAYFADVDNSTIEDIVVAGSLTTCLAYGSIFDYENSYPIDGYNCLSADISDPYGEGVSQSTPLSQISGGTHSVAVGGVAGGQPQPPPIYQPAPNLFGQKVAGGIIKGAMACTVNGTYAR